MIRQLRKKLILTCMLSLFVVLLVIVGIINISNYVGIVQDADSVLNLLKDAPTERPPSSSPMNWREAGPRFKSPELSFEVRFFRVTVREDGEIVSQHLDRIASVDAETAAEYAERARANAQTSGFIEDFRYLRFDEEGETQFIFLDCGRVLAGAASLLKLSIIISLGGLLAVLGLILLLSQRIVRPFIDNYEKQKRFITDAGHEIKTPLTIIAADAEMAAMESGESEWLKDIGTQVQRLTGLTNDLITLSRMEEANPAQMLDFPLSEVVSESVSSFSALAQSMGKSIKADIQPMLTLHGDENGISRLLSVLLDNALKFSPEHSTIVLELKQLNHAVRITVCNPAANISDDLLKNMFERFYRGDPSRGGDSKGYGVGLSIARAVAEAHGGSIGAECADGHTLTITVTLPV